ncbi:MAG TPA: TIGR02265 family protein [Myxococcaceae bacterium]|nr:TIGR02265 family protein [Myxococcaceae bacterium]
MNGMATEWSEAPYDWKSDCQLRLSLASPGDTARGLFFNGLLDTARTFGGEPLVRRCLEACGQEQFLDFFSYPVRMQLQIIAEAMETLVKRYASTERALKEVGRRASSDFLESMAGRAALNLGAGNPRRLLSSLPSIYRVSMSYGEYFLSWTGPNSGRFLFRRDFMPHHVHQGVVTAILDQAGAREVRVWGRQTGPLEGLCEFSWS